jgi:hypothetical protein
MHFALNWSSSALLGGCPRISLDKYEKFFTHSSQKHFHIGWAAINNVSHSQENSQEKSLPRL